MYNNIQEIKNIAEFLFYFLEKEGKYVDDVE